jgi:hypothetical protein
MDIQQDDIFGLDFFQDRDDRMSEFECIQFPPQEI